MFFALLRQDRALDRLVLDEAAQLGLIPRMLLCSICGLAAHGLMTGAVGALMLHDAPPGAFDWPRGQPLLWMPPALVSSFLGALIVCLPSFYFYTQLAGVDAPLALIVIQALRVMARTGLLLLGVLPFYLAFVLAAVLGVVPPDVAFLVGLGAPFAVGAAGLGALRRSFRELLAALPHGRARRGDFVLRFVVAWGGLYLTIAPVALWAIGRALGSRV